MAVAHVALDFGLRSQGSDGVDYDNVYGAGAHDHVADLQRLFARVGLADQEVFNVHAQVAGIDRIERVLRVDECTGAAVALALGNDLQSQCGFTGRFRPVDLNDAAARQAADAQRDIQAQRASRDGGNGFFALVAKAHHGAFTKLALYLG